MNHKSIIVFFSAILFSLLLFTACSEDDILDAIKEVGCELHVETLTIATEYNVTYKATKSGDGLFTSITYIDENGEEQTVSTPSTPWEKTIKMPANKIAIMFSTGVITNGKLKLELTATNNILTYTSEDDCSQSTN